MRLQRRSESGSTFRNLDWITIIIYLVMVFAGMVSIYAACYDFDNASMFAVTEFSGKQLRWIILSTVLALVLLLIDNRMYETYSYPIYIGVMLLLLITPFVAHNNKKSRSWISFGSAMSLQPAEFAKFATALALAKLFSSYHFVLNARWINYVKALAIILTPVVLILLQNETGSALTFMALFFVLYREGMSGLVLFAALFAIVIFVVAIKYSETMILGIPTGEFTVFIMIMTVMAGMAIIYSRRIEIGRNLVFWFAGCGLVMYLVDLCEIIVPALPCILSMLFIACVYIVIEAIKYRRPKLYISVATAVLAIGFMFSVNMAFQKLQPHQRLRIEVALGIVEDLRGAGYNVNQSTIAIGSGGFTGKGFLNGTQTKLKYVPEQHTDFNRRGRRFHRHNARHTAVSGSDTSCHCHRRTTTDHFRACLCLLRGLVFHISLLHKHRHGHRSVSGNRNSVAVLQLWWLVAVGFHYTTLHTPQARCVAQKLSGLLTRTPNFQHVSIV